MSENHSIAPDHIQEYLHDLIPDRSPSVEQLEKEADNKDFPIIGPLVGRFIKVVVSAIDPERVVELGSGFGYSAYWIASGAPNAEIHLTEYDEKNLERAKDFLGQTGFSARFRYHQGDGLEFLREHSFPTDCVFIDMEKENYPEALMLSRDTLEPGGWIIADNVLWDGKVAFEKSEDVATQSIKQFNRHLQADHWDSTIVPLRDGVALARLTE